MSDWYTLINRVPVPCPPSVDTPYEQRCVGRTKTPFGDVSTVFLRLDHRHKGDVPVLFETLVLDGPLEGRGERYATWDEAEAGHAKWVRLVASPLFFWLGRDAEA